MLFVIGYLTTLISMIPLIRKDNWSFRIFEYPRLQKLAINLFVLGAFLSLYRLSSTHDFVFTAVISLNLVFLFTQVLPFTPFNSVEMKRIRQQQPDRQIKVFIANVYQYNRNVSGLQREIGLCDPDVVLLVETDQWWMQQLEFLEKSHSHSIKVPLDNTYGLLFYSRLEVRDEKVRYLVEPDIPSVSLKIRLCCGQWVQFYGLHPTPPVPQENPRSTERDKEILMVAREAKACELPVIVAGDLNDVAWSYTTDLFSKTSGLLDPRKGRGFFNTFHARYFFLRFPLDHVFCSTDFKLVAIKRMGDIRSDHFPMFIHLQYDPEAPAEQKEPEADAQEQELADEKIHKPT